MFLVYLMCLFAVSLYKCQFGKTGTFDPMSMEQTTCVKGFFIVLILLSHASGYVPLISLPDRIFARINGLIGQLMVTVFFFYSGYGISWSYLSENGEKYKHSFLKRRVFKTWFHLVVALVLFLAVQLFLGENFSTKQIILSVFGWENIGNSNWYIFDQLFLYLISFFAFCLSSLTAKKQKTIFAVTVFALTIVFVFILSQYKESYWFNTIFTFPFGVFFYLVQKRSFPLSPKVGNAVLALSVFLFVIAYICKGNLAYNISACLFVLIITLSLRYVHVSNGILWWLGKNSFYVYIYMRIPMIVLQHYSCSNPTAFSAISILCTFLLAWTIGALQERIDKVLF